MSECLCGTCRVLCCFNKVASFDRIHFPTDQDQVYHQRPRLILKVRMFRSRLDVVVPHGSGSGEDVPCTKLWLHRKKIKFGCIRKITKQVCRFHFTPRRDARIERVRTTICLSHAIASISHPRRRYSLSVRLPTRQARNEPYPLHSCTIATSSSK